MVLIDVELHEIEGFREGLVILVVHLQEPSGLQYGSQKLPSHQILLGLSA